MCLDFYSFVIKRRAEEHELPAHLIAIDSACSCHPPAYTYLLPYVPAGGAVHINQRLGLRFHFCLTSTPHPPLSSPRPRLLPVGPPWPTRSRLHFTPRPPQRARFSPRVLVNAAGAKQETPSRFLIPLSFITAAISRLLLVVIGRRAAHLIMSAAKNRYLLLLSQLGDVRMFSGCNGASHPINYVQVVLTCLAATSREKGLVAAPFFFFFRVLI